MRSFSFDLDTNDSLISIADSRQMLILVLNLKHKSQSQTFFRHMTEIIVLIPVFNLKLVLNIFDQCKSELFCLI